MLLPLQNSKIPACIIASAAIVLMTSAASQASAAVHRLNPTETALFKKISRDADQSRRLMTLDPILCKVARKRAKDMARNSYFGHIDLSGRGPNRLAKRAGYVLPSWYDMSRSGNNIESIVVTGGSPAAALKLWKSSKPHRIHVLGTASFYQVQEAIGIGAFSTSGTPSQTYYVFLSAPENQAHRPPKLTLKNPAGRPISSTR